MNKLRVYSIGNILMDVLADADDKEIDELGLDKGIMKLVSPGERLRLLDFIASRDRVLQCGGSAPNTVITLSSLGVQTGLSGKVGRDELGHAYIRQLEEHGVRSYVSEEDGYTGTCIVLISPDSERTMNTDLAINKEYCRSNVSEEALTEADYFYFTGYMWDTPSQKEALTHAIKIAREKHTKIAFDLADPFAVNRSGADFLHMIEQHFDLVFANREEARLLLGKDSIEDCLDILAEHCEIAVIKNGKHGSLVAKADKRFRIPVNPVKAVDSTGAGDTYAAGFLYGLCQGFDIEKSGIFASWLASRIVEVKGAQFHKKELVNIQEALLSKSWEDFAHA